MTSAPKSPSIWVQVGPARTRVRSSTRSPRSGPVGAWSIPVSLLVLVAPRPRTGRLAVTGMRPIMLPRGRSAQGRGHEHGNDGGEDRGDGGRGAILGGSPLEFDP